METKRAAIYCRVSTEDQEREGTSLQTQLECCSTYCKNKDYDIPYRFSEAYSGLKLERPELVKLRELIRTEAIDVLVCYSLDRLTRDPGHGVIITQELEKHGVKLEAVTEDVDTSELGKLITYIRGYASKVEAVKIGERTMRGKKAHAEKGDIPAGFGRYNGYLGLKHTNKRLVHDGQIDIAREILLRCLDGESSSQITVDLQRRKVHGIGGGIIQRSAVSRVLRNSKVYSGIITWDGIVIKGKVEPIISEEQADQIQRQLARNQVNYQGFGKRTWLGGRVYCGVCGRRYRLDKRGCKCNGNDYRIPSRCQSPRIGLRELSALAYGTVTEAFGDPKSVIERVKQAHDSWEANRLLFEEVKSRKQAQQDNTDKRRRALSIQHEMSGLTDDEYARRLSDIKNEVATAPDFGVFDEPEPPTPEQIGKFAMYHDLIMYRGRLSEVLDNPRDTVANKLADDVNLKVVVNPPKVEGQKYSAQVLVDLPVKSETTYFPDVDDKATATAMVMLSKSSRYYARPLPLPPGRA
ncbi:MAG: recombinase family protein [Chloroflexota bacterium]